MNGDGKGKSISLGGFGYVVLILLTILLVSSYTFVLQKMYSESILENAVSENSARTDAMYQRIDSMLSREDFAGLNTIADISTDLYQELQAKLNEIRSMNSTRYFYTAKRGNDGRLIYLVDGLDMGSEDFRYPGDYIEDEMIPYIERALAGESVYSQEIVDTTWGHIFTACYPVSAGDGSGDIVGALCIEMDMEPSYRFIERRNHVAVRVAFVGVAVVVLVLALGILSARRRRILEEEQQRLMKEAADAAYSANHAKSVFLFNMSHDIRTPMNAIIGYAELSRKHLQEPEKLKEYMEKICTCGNSLLAMLNNVLDLARIENNGVSIEETAAPVKENFDTCIEMFENSAENKKQKILRHAELLHPYVYIDESHFTEILMNILSNAVKYTSVGGEIRCSLSQEEMSSQPGWCRTILTITDNGIGMSPEYQKHIFDAFSRERSTTLSGVEGSGLGMGIVKHLVDSMQGEISVQSRLGEGSTFVVSLPTRIASREDAMAKRADNGMDTAALQGRRVLLVEDNDLNAEIATELLTESGLLVERADDGVACIKMVEDAAADYYDVILMDIQMPVMNGYEATVKLRHLDDKQKSMLPIIAMTANAFAEDRQKALAVGMNDHVAKPIDLNVLLPTIGKFLGNADSISLS